MASEPDSSGTYPRLHRARVAASSAGTRARTAAGARARAAPARAARAAGSSARRGAVAQGRKVTGGFGTVFVFLTTAGVVFAIIRNPRLLTVPLGFITGVFQRFTGIFSLPGKVA